MADELAVGSTVWLYDSNHRVYRQRENGNFIGAPIYREHWVPRKITGENRSSWILNYSGKFPKKLQNGKMLLATYPEGGYAGMQVATSQQQVDDDVWKHDHRRYIVHEVESCSAEMLRKVADVIGYKA